MRLTESAEGDIAIFALEGEIDLHYAPVLRRLLQTKLKNKTPMLLLDLSQVDYIDSTGLATIIEYFRDAGEFSGVLCLVGLNSQLKTIFEIVRLDKTIPIFVTRTEAIEAFRRGGLQTAPSDFVRRPAA